MARGTQFRELIDMLNAELWSSLNRNAGLNAIENKKYALRNTYQWLYDEYDWPFLNIFVDEQLKAGQRIYSFDRRLNYEEISKTEVAWNGEWLPVPHGIGAVEYSTRKIDEREDPVRRWQVRADGQYEVWPTPLTDGVLRQHGVRKFTPLVNENDVCELDDLLVVLFTAARLQAKAGSKDAQATLSMAQARLNRLRAKTGAKKRRPFVLGGGSPTRRLRPGLDFIHEVGG